ncbi:putative GEM-like protein 8 [Ziziphus jujuba]|uniref:GEM-like protein 8 n=1 Tax=Ziziphus jujuba TaxID=326968 RepID=A0ABM4A520_ZIZJJ|nr:putative GEM-like protein 8 [Ziziphus jujuba]
MLDSFPRSHWFNAEMGGLERLASPPMEVGVLHSHKKQKHYSKVGRERLSNSVRKTNKPSRSHFLFSSSSRWSGVEKIFKQLFSVGEEEKLLKASQCYLSTTAGPIAGLLFTSNEKIAFCSEKSIKFSSPTGELIRIRYKVVILLSKIKRVNQSENVKKPSQKYMEIVTVDNFDFWFMGFVNYKKAFKYLQQALSQA